MNYRRSETSPSGEELPEIKLKLRPRKEKDIQGSKGPEDSKKFERIRKFKEIEGKRKHTPPAKPVNILPEIPEKEEDQIDKAEVEYHLKLLGKEIEKTANLGGFSYRYWIRQPEGRHIIPATEYGKNLEWTKKELEKSGFIVDYKNCYKERLEEISRRNNVDLSRDSKKCVSTEKHELSDDNREQKYSDYYFSIRWDEISKSKSISPARRFFEISKRKFSQEYRVKVREINRALKAKIWEDSVEIELKSCPKEISDKIINDLLAYQISTPQVRYGDTFFDRNVVLSITLKRDNSKNVRLPQTTIDATCKSCTIL